MAEIIGFIGLGVMGGPMARHLSAKRKVVVFDIDQAKRDVLDKAEKSQTVSGVGARADIVLLSLPSSGIVKEVVLGADGLLSAIKAGGVVVDTSTTEPSVSREIGAGLAQKGIDFMDAPVSGGEGAARDASLAIMAGGSEEVFERCKPILEIIGASIVRVGDIGMGGVTKLVNNMIVGATFAVIAEGFALGKANGVDPKVLYEAIKDGWAGSKVLSVAGPGIIDRNFKPGGTIDILFKDIGYALSLARTHNVPVPMTAMSDEVFKAARASGRGGQAQQVIIELWENLLGLSA
ncbi:MAG: NAD-binding protein [Planctomycetes bacterium]|nr:NAD-binding protein [Planctomycetota bacterium]